VAGRRRDGRGRHGRSCHAGHTFAVGTVIVVIVSTCGTAIAIGSAGGRGHTAGDSLAQVQALVW